MQGCCARNKKPVTAKVIAVNALICAIPIFITFLGGALLMVSGNPVGKSLQGFTETGLDQVRLGHPTLGVGTSNICTCWAFCLDVAPSKLQHVSTCHIPLATIPIQATPCDRSLEPHVECGCTLPWCTPCFGALPVQAHTAGRTLLAVAGMPLLPASCPPASSTGTNAFAVTRHSQA
jgi:hypothetical protein